ncbi:MAG: NTP transferase domain-containing protein [Deltaproteobacteria bacterium]|nr:NTP transferase domain-containing protein [Deltaproteobacteria bacterium]
MKNGFEKLLIANSLSVKETMRKMDEVGEKILFVMDAEMKLCGSVTDGDLRRWILKEGGLAEPIFKVYHKNPVFFSGDEKIESIRQKMIERKIDAAPVVDRENRVVDVLFVRELTGKGTNVSRKPMRIPVLVMAGGKGTRLDPFTRILPKPLIPFGEKPIIEIIMDHFQEFGCHDFFLTVNYKGKMIQTYFEQPENGYQVKLVWEDQPTGTAGSLKLAAPHIDAPHFFVTNCDILVKADYEDIYRFHHSNHYDITVVGSVQHLSVPFGVLEVKNGGHLDRIVEKPELDLLVNTGMYVVRREAADLIPEGVKFDFNEFMTKVKETGGRVGVYPVSQQSWIDLGQWQEYHTALRNLEG